MGYKLSTSHPFQYSDTHMSQVYREEGKPGSTFSNMNNIKAALNPHAYNQWQMQYSRHHTLSWWAWRVTSWHWTTSSIHTCTTFWWPQHLWEPQLSLLTPDTKTISLFIIYWPSQVCCLSSLKLPILWFDISHVSQTWMKSLKNWKSHELI